MSYPFEDFPESQTASLRCYSCGRKILGGYCRVCDLGEDYPEPQSPGAAARIARQQEDMRALKARQDVKRARIMLLTYPKGRTK